MNYKEIYEKARLMENEYHNTREETIKYIINNCNEIILCLKKYQDYSMDILDKIQSDVQSAAYILNFPD